MHFKQLLSTIKKNWKNLLFFAILFALIVSPSAKSRVLQAVIATGLFNADIKKESIINQKIAPHFSLTDFDGKIVSSSAFEGKVVFINFWASWCPPCRAEMPSLNKLYLELKNDNRFVFLFVNEDDDQSKALGYIQQHHFSIPIYKSHLVPSQIFSGALPTTLVLDKKGHIVLKHEGIADYNNDEFKQQLKALL